MLKSMLIVVLTGACCVQDLAGQVVLDRVARRQLDEILAAPLATYSLDLAGEDAMLASVDAWAARHMDLRRALRTKDGSSGFESFAARVPENKAIELEPTGGPSIADAITVRYEKQAHGRSFTKLVRQPVSEPMPKPEVEALARGFLRQQAFVREDVRDRVGDGHVISRARRDSTPDGESEELFVLHRAVFQREFDGVEVLNSRQIVDIHPRTRELLACKILSWTPVDGSSAQSLAYLSADEIVKRIEEAFEAHREPVRIERVRGAYVVGERHLLPVLIAEAEARPNKRVERFVVVLPAEVPGS